MIFQEYESISRMRHGKSRRCSSYDRTGGNRDYWSLEPGKRSVIADIQGAGRITHIWVTMAAFKDAPEDLHTRKVLIRIYWDGEENPSVEAPIGDFFGMGHGLTKNFTSAYLMMSPEDGKGFNSFFPMPFSKGARIEVESEAENPVRFYFYVDYTELESLPEDELRFHACWNRECPTVGIEDCSVTNEEFSFGNKNTNGDENYVILEAVGKGHYVGCNLNIHNLRPTREWNWYGEGDDMIFIDGEKWPPALHGTGTEDYFNTAWCPTQEVCTPYHGIIMGGKENWSGKISLYRYHVLDPVLFEKSIKVTIEHGHNNHRSDDYCSTAYWYQTEPHAAFKQIPDFSCGRKPLPDFIPINLEEYKKQFNYKNP